MSRIPNVRNRLARILLHRMVPVPDASPTKGGRGPHPLGPAGGLPLPSPPAGLSELGALCLAAGAGAEDIDSRIQQVLDSATPGPGEDWADIAGVAIRLIHLAALQAWSRPDGALDRKLAGLARFHVLHLVREHPFDDASPTTTLCHAALLIASFSWPRLAETKRWRGPSSVGLSNSLAAMLGTDGAPPYPLGPAVQAIWATCLARAWTQANHEGFLRATDSALLRGANAVWRIAGDTGSLPKDSGPDLTLLPLGTLPIGHTLRNLMLAWGLDQGPAGALPDPVCQLLCGKLPSEPPETMAGKRWALWAWRDSSMCVAHAQIRKQPSRFWSRPQGSTLQWEVGSQLVLRGGSIDGKLQVARVDGPAVRISYLQSTGTRLAVLRQARLQVLDEGQQTLTWHIDPAWQLAPSEKGFTGQIGRQQLLIKTDPAWSWSLAGPNEAGEIALVGTGEPQPIKSIFEIR